MKVLYFAWLRERVGKSGEEVAFPANVTTIGEAITFLSQLGENYAYAFEKPTLIRAAINQKHVKHDTPLAGALEIAFFPPMTGG
jgi:sulfur-carrier protein